MPLKNHDHDICLDRHMEAFKGFWSEKSQKLHLRLTHGMQGADASPADKLAAAHSDAHSGDKK